MSTALKLRLYTGGEDDPGSPANWTVRQAFEERVKPRLLRRGSASGTIDKWDRAIRYWEEMTADPPISLIGEDDLTTFPERLLEPGRTKIATTTAANQQQMYVAGVLRACEDILGRRAPLREPLPAQAPTRHRRVVKDDALAAIYRACRHATHSYDSRLPAPLVWRSLLVLYLSIGPRRDEGARMPRSAWHRDPEFPEIADQPELEIDASSPHGWLVFHTPKTRRRKQGIPLVLPVSELLARHLQELDRLSPRRERMFPISDHASCWRTHFNKIQRLARNPEIERPYTWQDLRKTAGVRYRRLVDQTLGWSKTAGREISKFMLGHQPRGVNAAWYDELTEDAVKAVARMEWPAAFHSALDVASEEAS